MQIKAGVHKKHRTAMGGGCRHGAHVLLLKRLCQELYYHSTTCRKHTLRWLKEPIHIFINIIQIHFNSVTHATWKETNRHCSLEITSHYHCESTMGPTAELPASRCWKQKLSLQQSCTKHRCKETVENYFPLINLAFLKLITKTPNTTTLLFFGPVTWLSALKCRIYLNRQMR